MEMLGLPQSLLASPGNSNPQVQVSAWATGTESQTKPRLVVGGGLPVGWVRREGWMSHLRGTHTETSCACKGQGTVFGIPFPGSHSWDPSLPPVAVSLMAPEQVPLPHFTSFFFHRLPLVTNVTYPLAQSPSHLGTWTLRFSVIPWSSWNLSW